MVSFLTTTEQAYEKCFQNLHYIERHEEHTIAHAIQTSYKKTKVFVRVPFWRHDLFLPLYIYVIYKLESATSYIYGLHQQLREWKLGELWKQCCSSRGSRTSSLRCIFASYCYNTGFLFSFQFWFNKNQFSSGDWFKEFIQHS